MLRALRWAEALSGGSELAMKLAIKLRMALGWGNPPVFCPHCYGSGVRKPPSIATVETLYRDRGDL